jgi:hypothetical protein
MYFQSSKVLFLKGPWQLGIQNCNISSFFNSKKQVKAEFCLQWINMRKKTIYSCEKEKA